MGWPERRGWWLVAIVVGASIAVAVALVSLPAESPHRSTDTTINQGGAGSCTPQSNLEKNSTACSSNPPAVAAPEVQFPAVLGALAVVCCLVGYVAAARRRQLGPGGDPHEPSP